MGRELFGIDVAGIVADVIAPGLHDVSIERYTEGARTAGNLTGGKPRTPATVVGVKGIWEDVPRFPPPGVTIELTDKVALLIGDTIPSGALPLRNDAITIAGETRYVVQLIGTDAADAHYRFLCRDRRGPDGV